MARQHKLCCLCPNHEGLLACLAVWLGVMIFARSVIYFRFVKNLAIA
ncbi:hypothetical protein [Tumidithrix helvetica]